MLQLFVLHKLLVYFNNRYLYYLEYNLISNFDKQMQYNYLEEHLQHLHMFFQHMHLLHCLYIHILNNYNNYDLPNLHLGKFRHMSLNRSKEHKKLLSLKLKFRHITQQQTWHILLQNKDHMLLFQLNMQFQFYSQCNLNNRFYTEMGLNHKLQFSHTQLVWQDVNIYYLLPMKHYRNIFPIKNKYIFLQYHMQNINFLQSNILHPSFNKYIFQQIYNHTQCLNQYYQLQNILNL